MRLKKSTHFRLFLLAVILLAVPCMCLAQFVSPVGGGSGAAPIATTYAGLFGAQGLATLDQLVTQQQYSFEFHSKFAIPGSGGLATHTGDPETLVVTAIDDDSISPIAESLTWPQDVIWYSPRNDIYDDGQSDRGTITRRIFVPRMIDADVDFRAAISRCWERSAETGIFSGFSDPGGGATYQDFPMFPVANLVDVGVETANDTGSVNIHTHRSGLDGKWAWPHLVFQSGAYRVRIGYGNDLAIFVGPVETADIGDCSEIAVEGGVSSYWSASGSNIKYATGDLFSVSVFKAVPAVNGSLNSCRIDSSYPGDAAINGSHTGVVFSSLPDGPGITSANLLDDPGFNIPAAWTGATASGGAMPLANNEETIVEAAPLTAIAGRSYAVGVIVTDHTAGAFELYLGGTKAAASINGNGVWQQTITTANTAGFSISNTNATANIGAAWVRLID